jgi:hypothetical protein
MPEDRGWSEHSSLNSECGIRNSENFFLSPSKTSEREAMCVIDTAGWSQRGLL